MHNLGDKVNFKPLNRYIEIEIQPISQPQTNSGILLPDDFKVDQHTWLVVDKSMIEEVNVRGNTINLVLDNYVLGLFTS